MPYLKANAIIYAARLLMFNKHCEIHDKNKSKKIRKKILAPKKSRSFTRIFTDGKKRFLDAKNDKSRTLKFDEKSKKLGSLTSREGKMNGKKYLLLSTERCHDKKRLIFGFYKEEERKVEEERRKRENFLKVQDQKDTSKTPKKLALKIRKSLFRLKTKGYLKGRSVFGQNKKMNIVIRGMNSDRNNIVLHLE